jgi:hypothetical protein
MVKDSAAHFTNSHHGSPRCHVHIWPPPPLLPLILRPLCDSENHYWNIYSEAGIPVFATNSMYAERGGARRGTWIGIVASSSNHRPADMDQLATRRSQNISQSLDTERQPQEDTLHTPGEEGRISDLCTVVPLIDWFSRGVAATSKPALETPY